MKAAVLNNLDTLPVYTDFRDAVPENENHLVVNMKAAALHNLDKLRASGKHYANYSNLPTVVGFDGVGTLADGTRIYAQGVTGMMAEKAIIDKNRFTVLPAKLDLNLAAALPNAVIGSAMPLLYRGKFKKGEIVLINGATGVSGHMAVQLAKYYGASKIIVTGRNAEALEKLMQIGADETVSLIQEEEAILEQLKNIHKTSPINLVIDYLWGKPAELILQALKGGGVNSFTKTVRFVTVGEMAGSTISLPSGLLRSTAIEILGSGIGSLSKEEMADYNAKILPEVFQLASDGIITMNIQQEKLEDIERIWNAETESGYKIVIAIN